MALSKIDLANQVENQLPQSLVADNVNFRNIIINGDMSIAQRGTSETGITSEGYYTVDRFIQTISNGGTWTQSQDTDVPSGQGFSSSLKLDCTTADTDLGTSGFLSIGQRFEGQNLQYLKYGTSNAESLTLSFWVKSNKTGTYTVEFQNIISGTDRINCQEYTISSADTWEKKTITIDGDIVSGKNINNDNSLSFWCQWWLGGGTNYTSGTLQTSWGDEVTANRVSSSQVNLADSTSNEWYITGIQLEAGTTASDFEFLPVDVNLNRCFRYYYKYCEGGNSSLGLGVMHVANQMDFTINFPTQMRTNPSVDQVTGTDYYQFYHNAADNFNGIDSIQDQGQNHQTYLVSSNISGSAHECGIVYGANASAYIAADAEL